MIDWFGLAANAVWIAGCMLALAALSIGQWRARNEAARLRDVLARPMTQVALFIATVLFCLGMLATSSTWLERIAWGALAIAFSVQGLLAYRRARRVRNET
ncbi:MAG: hypothetical protein M1434_09810 [Chloroflexi bacterium]|nr:hypothetical protein [Chloroflexota bacterium]